MVVHLFFDYGSLDCYMAWKRLAARADILWKPVAWKGSAVDGSQAALGHLVAAAEGKESEWMRRAFEAQWVHGRGIQKAAVVEQVGVAVGIADFARKVKDEAHRRQLESNLLEASLHRVPSVPCALVDGQVHAGAAAVQRLATLA